MVRLKKLQRNPNLRKSPRGGPGAKRGLTLMNFLACICLLLNGMVLGLSLLIKGRLKDGADVAQPANNGNAVNEAAVASNNLRSKPKNQVSNAPPVYSSDSKYHFVFTSDCKDPAQDWQVYVFFYYVTKSNQPGDVTHIVTGCNQGPRQTFLEQFHKSHFEPMGRINAPNSPSRFHLHFAPADPNQAAAGLLRTHMKYFNRPYGVHHWMENKLGYNKGESSNENDDKVIVLMEKDMVLLKSFGSVLSGELWKDPDGATGTVSHGHPVAQHEPFGPGWWEEIPKSSLSAEIAEGVSTVQSMSHFDFQNHYSAGPPFFVTCKDFYPLVQKWIGLTQPLFLAMNERSIREPHAPYILAAAMLQKPHQLANTFSVSQYRSEAFVPFERAFVNGTPGGGTGALCRSPPKDMMPHILQYSKRYALGNFVIGKHYVGPNFLGKPESCSDELLAEPPSNVADMFAYYKDPETGTRVEIDKEHNVHQMTFLLCETIEAFNAAAIHYKQHNCQGEVNLKKSKMFD